MARRLLGLAAALCLMAGAVGSVRAEDPVAPQGQEFASVPRLFERIHATFSGRILTVELALTDRPAYEVKLLTERGNVLMLSYDAMTLRLDSVVGHRDPADDDAVAAAFRRADQGGDDGVEGDDVDDDGDDRDDDDDDRDDDDDGNRDDGRDGDRDDDPVDGDDGDNSGPSGDDGGSGGGNSGPGGGDDD